MGLRGSNVNDEPWLKFGYVLMVEPTGFCGRSDVRKRRVRDDSNGLSSWKEGDITEMGISTERADSGEESECPLWDMSGVRRLLDIQVECQVDRQLERLAQSGGEKSSELSASVFSAVKVALRNNEINVTCFCHIEDFCQCNCWKQIDDPLKMSLS